MSEKTGKIRLQEWQQVLEEFSFCCAYCGRDGNLTQDHYIPRSKGGKTEIGNIVPACRECNAEKKNNFWKIEPKHHFQNY